MQSRKLFKSVALIGLIVPCAAFAQKAEKAKEDKVMINKGKMSIVNGGVMSTLYDFENTAEGIVNNDGTVYYYSNFHNENIYSHSKDAKGSKAVFTPADPAKGAQKISTKATSKEKPGIAEFYNVELNNPTAVMAFDLKGEMDVNGTVDFKDGIIKVDQEKGALTFLKGAKANNPTDKSHAEGFVGKVGNEEFQFPKGDEGLYRYARISAPGAAEDAYEGKFSTNDAEAFFRARKNKAGVIDLVDMKEYWTVEKGNDNSKNDVMLTLSWDERTTPAELLINPEKELHIIRWDAKQQMWVDEGGAVDLERKEITTVSTVRGYGFFTLGTVKTDLLLDGDVVIYNLVTPDGDGMNDYFIIDNINRFPNNTVEIYNRWGVKVYDAKNYDSAGDGSVNVFNGYSEGRVTVNKNEKLPTGTYFYIVNYEYKDAQGSRMIKKSGYLHLDTN